MEGFPLVGLVDRTFHFHFLYMCPQVVYFYGQEFLHVKTMFLIQIKFMIILRICLLNAKTPEKRLQMKTKGPMPLLRF